jgi:hypothetical protein
MSVTLNAGSGGAVLNTDDVAGVSTQRIKIAFSLSGAAPVDVSASVGLPVNIVAAETLPIAGSVMIHDTAGNGLTSTAVSAKQALDVNIVAGAGAGGTSIADGSTFTTGATAETPVGALVVASAPTYTAGKVNALTQTTGGALNVNVESGGAAAGTAGAPSTDVLSVQGCSASYVNGIAPATPAVVTAKSSAGAISAIICSNLSTDPVFIKFWDTATAPTLGTTACTYQFMIPGDANGRGFVIPLPNVRLHTHAIYFAITNGIAANDDTGLTVNTVLYDVAFN